MCYHAHIMILAFHFILSAYGFWLPNDPRGSWSECIRQYELLRFGPATKSLITSTHSVAAKPHDEATRLAAKTALRYPPVEFTGVQARAIARGFAIAAKEHGFAIHALAILPDHVHLVMAWHRRHIDDIAAHLKAKATRQLSLEELHPMKAYAARDGRMRSPWARNYWCPFIDSLDYMRKASCYVQRNPLKSGLRPQRWNCIVPYQPITTP
jgi:REP element-mobilizing transposase RayT